MLKNFKIPAFRINLRDRKTMVRAGLGVLTAANLLAAFFVYRTPGGTLAQLEEEIVSTRRQLVQRQRDIDRLKKLVAYTEQARQAGDAFLASYFLPRKHAYSLLEIDLTSAAKAAGIASRERSFNYEPIEGSDTLGLLTINAGFEGSYADLVEFVNQIDRSRRLLILEQLQAQPQVGSTTLQINVKMNAFFRFEGPQESDLPPPPDAKPETKAPEVALR
jgi:Tfp pilus assembly protein PilO